jgi:hypothetical protein
MWKCFLEFQGKAFRIKTWLIFHIIGMTVNTLQFFAMMMYGSAVLVLLELGYLLLNVWFTCIVLGFLEELKDSEVRVPVPNKNVPMRNLPMGNVPMGNLPMGNVPMGNLPMGNVPMGNVPMGNLPMGNTPMGSAPPYFSQPIA